MLYRSLILLISINTIYCFWTPLSSLNFLNYSNTVVGSSSSVVKKNVGNYNITIDINKAKLYVWFPNGQVQIAPMEFPIENTTSVKVNYTIYWGRKSSVQDIIKQIKKNQTTNIFKYTPDILTTALDDTYFFVLLQINLFQRLPYTSIFQTLIIGRPEHFYVMREYKQIQYGSSPPYPLAYYNAIVNHRAHNFNSSLSNSKNFTSILNGSNCDVNGMYVDKISLISLLENLWSPLPSVNVERQMYSPSPNKIRMQRGGCLIEIYPYIGNVHVTSSHTTIKVNNLLYNRNGLSSVRIFWANGTGIKDIVKQMSSNLIQNPFLCDLVGTDFQNGFIDMHYFALFVQFEQMVKHKSNPSVFQLAIIATNKNIYLVYEYIQIFYNESIGPYPKQTYHVTTGDIQYDFKYPKSGLSDFKEILQQKSCFYNKEGQIVARIARGNYPVITLKSKTTLSTTPKATITNTTILTTTKSESKWSQWSILINCMPRDNTYVRLIQRTCIANCIGTSKIIKSEKCVQDTRSPFTIANIATALGRLTLFNLTRYNKTLSNENLTTILTEKETIYSELKNDTEKGLFLLFQENKVDVKIVAVLMLSVGSLVVNYEFKFNISNRQNITKKELNPVKRPSHLYTKNSSFTADTSPMYSDIIAYNECNTTNSCHKNAHCYKFDSKFSYACQCKTGYRGNGFTCEEGSSSVLKIVIITVCSVVGTILVITLIVSFIHKRRIKNEKDFDKTLTKDNTFSLYHKTKDRGKREFIDRPKHGGKQIQKSDPERISTVTPDGLDTFFNSNNPEGSTRVVHVRQQKADLKLKTQSNFEHHSVEIQRHANKNNSLQSNRSQERMLYIPNNLLGLPPNRNPQLITSL